MSDYDSLFDEITKKHLINKGDREEDAAWKTRIIYSVSGLMAYTSLWEVEEGRDNISIHHFRKKTRDIFSSYMTIAPNNYWQNTVSNIVIEDEIESIYKRAGAIYSSSKVIAPAMKCERAFNGVLFQRGIAIDEITCVSGLGFYKKANGALSSNKFKEMFGLAQDNLETLWLSTLQRARWKINASLIDNSECLDLYTYSANLGKYWNHQYETSGSVSLLRTTTSNQKSYYLYRFINGQFEVSRLPQWQTEDDDYLLLACACLNDYGTLPAIDYFQDGSIVYLHLNYLLPPPELAFLHLYSWPDLRKQEDYKLNRVLSTNVFSAVKRVLSSQGYMFQNRELL
jgi:hypothetical protein